MYLYCVFHFSLAKLIGLDASSLVTYPDTVIVLLYLGTTGTTQKEEGSAIRCIAERWSGQRLHDGQARCALPRRGDCVGLQKASIAWRCAPSSAAAPLVSRVGSCVLSCKIHMLMNVWMVLCALDVAVPATNYASRVSGIAGWRFTKRKEHGHTRQKEGKHSHPLMMYSTILF